MTEKHYAELAAVTLFAILILGTFTLLPWY